MVCVVSLILAIFNYFGIFGSKVISLIDMVMMIVIFIVVGYVNGKSAEKNGYLVGFKFGGILTLVLLFLSLLVFRTGFKFSSLIYYLVLIVSCVFGSMIGINKKKNEF